MVDEGSITAERRERVNRRPPATIGSVSSDDESQQAATVPEARIITDVDGIFDLLLIETAGTNQGYHNTN